MSSSPLSPLVYVNVTATYSTKLRTGIQRVVIELVDKLSMYNNFVPIAFDKVNEAFFRFVDFSNFEGAIYNDSFRKQLIDLSSLRSGDVFFDIDAVWNDNIDRTSLYEMLKAKGVLITQLHYDAVPLIHPRFSHPVTVMRYAEYFLHQACLADHVFVISRQSERVLQNLSEDLVGHGVESSVIRLGSDHADGSPEGSHIREAVKTLASRRFFLCVGTLEPRKNHELLLSAFEAMSTKEVCLVLAGKEGWCITPFVDRLTDHGEYNRRIFWFSDANDDEIALLYRTCIACVIPSHYEGFGLPAIEALRRGRPLIASDGGALPEVVGNHAAVFSSGDKDKLCELLTRAAADPTFHATLQISARSFEGTSWRSAAAEVKTYIEDRIINGAHLNFDQPVRQIVYISANPEKLQMSMRSVRKDMRFIDRALVLCPGRVARAMKHMALRLFEDVIVVTDEELLTRKELSCKDHVSRNTLLRQKLYAQDDIDDNFVASDDDYVCRTSIEPTFFVEKGVHRGYYFLTDIANWEGAYPVQTSYDRGLMHTLGLLRRLGCPARAFSSHMPQIINKALCNRIFARFLRKRLNFDEWSLYFNIASHLYPRKFCLEKYVTLYWPMQPADWAPELVPDRFVFENVYPETYAPNGRNGSGENVRHQTRIESYVNRILAARAEEIGTEDAPKSALVVVVDKDCVRILGDNRIHACSEHVRRVFLDVRFAARHLLKEMTVVATLRDGGGAIVRRSLLQGHAAKWLPLAPPEKEGNYFLHITVEHPTFGVREVTMPLELSA